VEPVNLVDEEEIAVLHICENTGEIARLFDLGTARDVNFAPESARKDVREGRFAESGRAAEEYVIKGVVPPFGRLNHEHKTLFHLRLTTEFLEVRRSQALFKLPRRRRGGIGWIGGGHG